MEDILSSPLSLANGDQQRTSVLREVLRNEEEVHTLAHALTVPITTLPSHSNLTASGPSCFLLKLVPPPPLVLTLHLSLTLLPPPSLLHTWQSTADESWEQEAVLHERTAVCQGGVVSLSVEPTHHSSPPCLCIRPAVMIREVVGRHDEEMQEQVAKDMILLTERQLHSSSTHHLG